MSLPQWVIELRRELIVTPVQQLPNTYGDFFHGVHKDEIFKEVIGGGQANFDEKWKHISSENRVLLYSYLNQLRHLNDLYLAFKMFLKGEKPVDPVVIDIGCGPFTGGWALMAALNCDYKFSYLGLDFSKQMRDFGEIIARNASFKVNRIQIERFWASDFNELGFNEILSYRPVIVIVSYLLASSNLDEVELVANLNVFISTFSKGPVTLVFANSVLNEYNKKFPTFKLALEKNGLKEVMGGIDKLEGGSKNLKFAIFHRNIQNVLE